MRSCGSAGRESRAVAVKLNDAMLSFMQALNKDEKRETKQVHSAEKVRSRQRFAACMRGRHRS